MSRMPSDLLDDFGPAPVGPKAGRPFEVKLWHVLPGAVVVLWRPRFPLEEPSRQGTGRAPGMAPWLARRCPIR